MQHDEIMSPVSFVAHVARLPQAGLPVTIDADEAQRAALAEAHGLLSVEMYRVELIVSRWKRNGVKVSGTVKADITQACVVTLDPVAAHIEEAVDGLFLPQDSKFGREGFGGAGEILIDAEGPDAPETFSGDTVDVGALAEQFFGLAIDPYPHREGVHLETEAEDENRQESEFQRKLRALLPKN